MLKTTRPPEFEAWSQAPRKGELRLIPIGGVGEFGMNALVVHSAESLFLVDCGQLFPSDDEPGIDSIIPDFAYLEPFADRIDGILLTHAHEDHLGAVPYFLERWPVPVYGTAFTLALLEGKLQEFDVPKGLLHPVEDFERVAVGRGEIEAEWIPVTHSIPDACALALHTPLGVVVHSGDFKLDDQPVDGRRTGMDRLAELGKAGVAALLADSTNVMRPGRAASEEICRTGLREAFRQTKGRLFAAMFSSNIHRLQILLDLAYEEGRKVVLMGRSLERNAQRAMALKILHLPDDLFIAPQDVALFPPDQVLVICTGSQGEELAALSRILRGEVKGLRLTDGDRLVLSARPIPGNEVAIARLLDEAARQGAETDSSGLGPIHATGHGHREDAEALIRAVRPHRMVPVHGNFRNLQAHGRIAEALGWSRERIHLLEGGSCLQFGTEGSARLAGSVPVGRLYVDQGVSHHVDARVVNDRLILQEDGIVVATLLVDSETGELAADPTILTRGFVKLSDDEAYGALLRATARQAFEDAPDEVRRDRDLLIELLRQNLRRVIRKTTQTRPMVVPMVLEAPAGEG